MWAAEIGRVNAARILLEYVVYIYAKNNDDMTALNLAVQEGRLGIT
jgi:ankyrin repeat protein